MRELTFRTLLTAAAISVGFAALASVPAASAFGSHRAFNPQPEPPKIKWKGGHRAFNPQPEPPKIKRNVRRRLSRKSIRRLKRLKHSFVLPGTRKAATPIPQPPPKARKRHSRKSIRLLRRPKRRF